MDMKSSDKMQDTAYGTSAFYVPKELIVDSRVDFPESELHHLLNVLRLKEGDEVEVLDGEGGEYRVRLCGERKQLHGIVLESSQAERNRPLLSAAFFLGKKERNKIAVEKLAELGCERIFPLRGDYGSFIGNSDKEIKKLELAAVAALKQSRGMFLCRIEKEQSLEKFFGSCEHEKIRPVICNRRTQDIDYSRGPCNSFPENEVYREYVLVVGPEGGFSPDEINLIRAEGVVGLNLGGNVLRFETALICGFVLLQSIFSEKIYFYR